MAELVTVKKGTPLYGQPSWWGEDDDDGDDGEEGDVVDGAHHTDECSEDSGNKRSRPNSLSLSGSDITGSPKVRQGSEVKMEGHRAVNYMEIPIRDDASPEDDVNAISMISKDSLGSPDGKSTNGTAHASPSTDAHPPTVFTIDLEGTPTIPTPNTSLSELMPSRLRRSFRERKEKIGSRGSKESTPSKNSEERELSPSQQRKINDLWSNVESKGKVRSLTSVQATLGSLRSPNLGDIDSLTDGDKKGHKATPIKSPQTSRRVRSSLTLTSDLKVKGSQVKAEASPVSHAQYSDPTSYLIDKMFEGGPRHSSSSLSSTSSHPEASTESRLYREATAHDRGLREVKVDAGVKVTTSMSTTLLKPVEVARVRADTYNKDDDDDDDDDDVVVDNSDVGVDVSDILSEHVVVVRKDTLTNHEDIINTNGHANKNNNKTRVEDDLNISEGVKDQKKEEDKASEAGTYTIEADKEDEDEEKARQMIDEVFGVAVDSFVDTDDDGDNDRHRADVDVSPCGGYDNVGDVDDDRTPMAGKSRLPGGDDDDDDDDDDDLVVADEEDQNPPSPGMAADGVTTWVSQLTALTSQKAQHDITREGSTPSSKKPPLSRKRPGTGRKLPSIPGMPSSPMSSEHSSYVSDRPDLHIPDDLPSSPSSSTFRCSPPRVTSDFVVNGKNNNNGLMKSPPKMKSPPPLTPTTPSSSITKVTRMSSLSQVGGSKVKRNGHLGSASPGASPCSTSRSRGSVDTELLLQDTETVMAAMEARMAHKIKVSGRIHSPGGDSDTDASSCVALVNGDDDYVKPTLYKSPRDALSKRQNASKDANQKTNGGGVTSTTPVFSVTARRSLGRSYSQTLASKSKAVSSPRSAVSATKKSVVSDVYSRTSDGVDPNDSIVSDVGSVISDVSDGNLSRTGSKGKGTISMAKPNRAFQLRRSRAESFEEPTTPKTTARSGSTARSNGGSSVRSSSVHSSARRAPSTNRSTASEAASLGGQIARKGRDNTVKDTVKDRAMKSSTDSLYRADGGRHSLRLNRATSLSIAKDIETSNKREPAAPRSAVKSRDASNSRGNLSVTGVSSRSISARSDVSSQPSSRTSSPRAAERMAWKRRKEYDPRRAVAEAKAKTKDPPSSSSSTSNIHASTTASSSSTRPKPSVKDNYKQRMIRSASFTNSKELQLSAQNALSASHDLIPNGKRNGSEPDGYRRAFLPFQNSLRSERSAFSEDEDTLVSAASTQASYDTLIVSSIFHLSQKLKNTTDKTMGKLREAERVHLTPSPMDDFLCDSQGKSEIMAWRSANQELAGVLKNLRRIERHVQMMDRVLFPSPESDGVSDVSSVSGLRPGQNYVQEIERIRNEIKGFQPIEPVDLEVHSPDMAEFSGSF